MIKRTLSSCTSSFTMVAAASVFLLNGCAYPKATPSLTPKQLQVSDAEKKVAKAEATPTVAAPAPPLGKTYTIPYPLYLDGKKAPEELIMYMEKKTFKPYISPTDVADILKKRLDSATYTKLKAMGDAPRPAGELIDGVALDFDAARQIAVLRLTADARDKQAIALSEFDYDIPDTELEEPAKVSAYLNIFPNISFIHATPGGGGTGLQDITVALDGATRLGGDKGFVIEGSGAFRENADDPFIRNDTRLVYDKPEWLTRFTLGDIDMDLDGFQEGLSIGGVGISSEFGLQPNRIFRPTGQRSIRIDRRTEAEIFVNGARFKTLSLDPGRYELSDFPLTAGSNNVEIVLEDDTGRRETLSFSNYQDFEMLKTGAQEFGYHAGVSSTPDGGDISYDGNIPVFSGFHRYGLTEQITVSANAQATDAVQTAGAGALIGTPYGLFGGDSAFSNSDTLGGGYAGNLRYRFATSVTRANDKKTGLFDDYAVEWRTVYFSENFVGLGNAASSTEWSVIPSLSTSISDNISMFANAQYDILHGNNPDRTGATLGLQWTVNDRTNFLTQLRYFSDGATDDVTALFTLTYRFGERDSISAGYSTEGQQTTLDYSRAADDKVGSVGGNVSVARTQDDNGTEQADIGIGADYTGNRFLASFDTDTSLTDYDTGNANWRSNLRLSTAFVFADGAAGFSRPVFDSFAIIDQHKSSKQASVFLERDDDGYRASSDMLGDAVATDVFPYFPNSIDVDVDNLPVGYDIGKGRYDLLPAYKSGYRLAFGSEYSVTVIGTLDPEYAETMALTAGKIYSLTEDDFTPVTTFTNRKGRFASGGMKPGDYEIAFKIRPPIFARFTIPDNGENLIRLDNVALFSESKRKP